MGHPLSKSISTKALYAKKDPNLLAIFPGSRKKEIMRNLPLQIEACKEIKVLYPYLNIQISVANADLLSMIKKMNTESFELVMPESSYHLMQKCTYAIATSGTVTLELALHSIAAVVTYGLSRFDQFIATKIFNINLPHYCIVNIIVGKTIYPELVGSKLTKNSLISSIKKMIETVTIESQRADSLKLKKELTDRDASVESAQEIIKLL